MAAPGLEPTTFFCKLHVFGLCVVCCWPRATCQNSKFAMLKDHYILAYGRPNGWEPMPDGLRPTTKPKPAQGQKFSCNLANSGRFLTKSSIHRSANGSRSGQATKLKVLGSSRTQGLIFRWKRVQILQNTIDFVSKVGLWIRLLYNVTKDSDATSLLAVTPMVCL